MKSQRAPSSRLDVVPLARGQIREAAGLLTRAFSDDPVAVVYMPDDPVARVRVAEIVLTDALRFHQRFGTVFAAMHDRQLIGAAVCVPPALRRPSLHYRLRNRARGLLSRRRIEGLVPDVAEKLFVGYANAERAHPAEPHWYPMFVCIAPEHQGRGYGSQLLAPVLGMADETQTLTFAETPFPRNYPFFERLGFEIGEEVAPFPDAPPLRFMRRRPRPVTPARA